MKRKGFNMFGELIKFQKVIEALKSDSKLNDNDFVYQW